MKRLHMFVLAAVALSVSLPVYAAEKVSNADKITDFAIQKVNSVIDLAAKAMPKVTEYAMKVTAIDCAIYLSKAIIPFVFGLVFSFLCWKCIRWKGENPYSDWDVGAILCAIVVAVCTLFSVIILWSPWKWVCVFNPDLYLIHLAVQKVTG